jgi:hypothetical protein
MHRAVETEAWFVQYFVAMVPRELPDSARCMESVTTLAESTTGVFVMHPVAESSSPIDTCAVCQSVLSSSGANELQSRLCVPSTRPIGVDLET